MYAYTYIYIYILTTLHDMSNMIITLIESLEIYHDLDKDIVSRTRHEWRHCVKPMHRVKQYRRLYKSSSLNAFAESRHRTWRQSRELTLVHDICKCFCPEWSYSTTPGPIESTLYNTLTFDEHLKKLFSFGCFFACCGSARIQDRFTKNCIILSSSLQVDPSFSLGPLFSSIRCF